MNKRTNHTLAALLVLAAFWISPLAKAQSSQQCAQQFASATQQCQGAAALTMSDITTDDQISNGAGSLLGYFLAPLVANQQAQCMSNAYIALGNCLSNAAEREAPPPDGILASLDIQNSSDFVDLELSNGQVDAFVSTSSFGLGGMDAFGAGGGAEGFGVYMGE
jgi:hypothetical protein